MFKSNPLGSDLHGLLPNQGLSKQIRQDNMPVDECNFE
jgi:hypothetical protein